MLASELSKILSELPPDAMLPVSWIRARLDAPLPVETDGDLSCADIGAILHRTAGCVRGWCFRGELKGYRLNNRDWRVSRKSLRQYLDAQGGSPAAEKSPTDLSSWREKRRGAK